jgi:hypothetical protein
MASAPRQAARGKNVTWRKHVAHVQEAVCPAAAFPESAKITVVDFFIRNECHVS